MRLLAGQAHPGTAHHGGDLCAPQRLLVLVVEFEEGLRQLWVVVMLLEPSQYVLEPVEPGLDLAGGAAHTGARRSVDPFALLRHGTRQRVEHPVQTGAGSGAGEAGAERAGHLDVGVRGAGRHRWDAPVGEVRDLGGEFGGDAVGLRPRVVQLVPQAGDLVAECGPVALGAKQPASEDERQQGPGGQAACGQNRLLDHRTDLGRIGGI